MQDVDCRNVIDIHIGTDITQTYHLAKIAQRWDRGIHRELLRFAHHLWSGDHFLGLIPIHSYRLRKRMEPGIFVWWIERDIPPFDRYRCEAYRIELSLIRSNQPRLIVRSGSAAYPVIPLSMENLKVTLHLVCSDMPLVIPRQFDPALDP